MAGLYKTFYNIYNKQCKMNQVESELYKKALEQKLPFHEAYLYFFEHPYLYQIYKIHLTKRPTLKRLATLAVLDIRNQKENVDLSTYGEDQMPISLSEEVKVFSRFLWTIDTFYCGARLFDFTPMLSDPEEAVGKEMCLKTTEHKVKLSFTSLTPGWDVHLGLWVIPKIFYIMSTQRDPARCLDAIVSEGNIGKLKLVFLKYSGDYYFFDFHYIMDECDFTY